LEEYEALVLRLAERSDERAALRQRLAENLRSTPLFDSRRFTRNLDALYLAMWQRHQEGRAPDVIA